MARRVFSREFKVEAVRLVRERGVSVAQASRDIDVHENVLRKWVKEFGADPVAEAAAPQVQSIMAAHEPPLLEAIQLECAHLSSEQLATAIRAVQFRRFREKVWCVDLSGRASQS
jgi:transposase